MTRLLTLLRRRRAGRVVAARLSCQFCRHYFPRTTGWGQCTGPGGWTRPRWSCAAVTPIWRARLRVFAGQRDRHAAGQTARITRASPPHPNPDEAA